MVQSAEVVFSFHVDALVFFSPWGFPFTIQALNNKNVSTVSPLKYAVVKIMKVLIRSCAILVHKGQLQNVVQAWFASIFYNWCMLFVSFEFPWIALYLKECFHFHWKRSAAVVALSGCAFSLIVYHFVFLGSRLRI